MKRRIEKEGGSRPFPKGGPVSKRTDVHTVGKQARKNEFSKRHKRGESKVLEIKDLSD